MLTNYLKIAARTLRKQKGYTLINLLGLTVGMTCTILILLYVQDEYRYDQYHRDSERIYRVVKDFVSDDGTRTPDATTPPALLPALLRDVPEIEQGTRIFPSWGFKPLISYENKSFYEGRFLRVDSTFFDVFTFRVIRGDAALLFSKPQSIVLTESMSTKYFGDEDPIGKQINFDRAADMEVVGVVEDVPPQTHFDFDFLISIRTLQGGDFAVDGYWGWYNFYTYVRLKPKADRETAEEKIQAVFSARQPENDNAFYMQPLAGLDGIHLNSNLKWELGANSDRKYLYIFLIIALCVIVIAGVNYVNLATARSMVRAREVGVRKAVGAARNSLMWQFLTESVVTSAISALAAVILASALLPSFNSLTQKDLSVLTSGSAGWLIVAVTLFCGVAAGIYPALYLSRMRPVVVLKGSSVAGRGGLRLRQILVVLQFGITAALIAGVLVIHEQMQFIQSTRLGFSPDHVVAIRNAGVLPNRGEGFRRAALEIPGVESVASTDGMVGGQNWTNYLRAKDNPNGQLVNFLSVGYDFLDALDIDLKEGRAFSPEHPSDSADAIILNEMAVRSLGIEEPAIGAQIVWDEDADSTVYATVVGIVKDFHFTSLRSEIKPFAFIYSPGRIAEFVVEYSGNDVGGTVASLESAWNESSAGRPFDYYFLDDLIEDQYRFEQNFRRVFSAMTLLSLFVACLGLFGLSAFLAENRTKEIGVRKVLGASVVSLVRLMSNDFLILVLIALAVASPVAYLAMDRWLADFAYHVDLGPSVFAVSAILVVVIALLTVSYQSLKTALANPVKSLRYE